MRWYGLRVLTDRAAGVRGGAWKLLWEASVAGEQADEGSAIFLAQDGPGRVTLYFSPPAESLATTVGARRCAKPAPDGLTLLAGVERAWDVYFSADAAASPLRAQAA